MVEPLEISESKETRPCNIPGDAYRESLIQGNPVFATAM